MPGDGKKGASLNVGQNVVILPHTCFYNER